MVPNNEEVRAEQPTDIEESLKTFIAVAQVANAGDKALAVLTSGGGVLAKLKIMGVIMDAAPAALALSELNVKELEKEMKDYSDVDVKTISKAFAETLDFRNDKIEYTVEQLVEAAGDAKNIAVKGIELAKKVVGMFKPEQLNALAQR